MSTTFMAYENETDSLNVGDMTIENRLDRVSVYGNLDITKDKEGLEMALKLKKIIDCTIDALKKDKTLPDKIDVVGTDTVENPFI